MEPMNTLKPAMWSTEVQSTRTACWACLCGGSEILMDIFDKQHEMDVKTILKVYETT